MCNLYNVTTNQEAIRALFNGLDDKLGNLPPSLDVYPDRLAPVVRNGSAGGLELVNLTWGLPTPEDHITPGTPDTGITNIRNLFFKDWLAISDVPHRCVVPVSAFCEWSDAPDPVTKRKRQYWFALDESQPLFWFPGIWTTWEGERGSKKNPRAGIHELFAFATCKANDLVGPIHRKAMPVMLTTREEVDIWMNADWREATKLAKPFAVEKMMIVDRAKKPTETASLF